MKPTQYHPPVRRLQEDAARRPAHRGIMFRHRIISDGFMERENVLVPRVWTHYGD